MDISETDDRYKVGVRPLGCQVQSAKPETFKHSPHKGQNAHRIVLNPRLISLPN